MYHHLGPCHVRPSPNWLQTAWGHCGGAVAVCHNCQGAKNASGIYQATRVINLTKFDIHENLGKPIQRNPTNWGTFWLVGKIRGILSKSRQSRFVTICHAFSDKCYNFKSESFNCVTICHDFVFFDIPGEKPSGCSHHAIFASFLEIQLFGILYSSATSWQCSLGYYWNATSWQRSLEKFEDHPFENHNCISTMVTAKVTSE